MVAKRLIDGEQSLQRATVKHPARVNGQRCNRGGTCQIGVIDVGNRAVRRKGEAQQAALAIAVGQIGDVEHDSRLERVVNEAMNRADARDKIHRRVAAASCGINGLIQRADFH